MADGQGNEMSQRQPLYPNVTAPSPPPYTEAPAPTIVVEETPKQSRFQSQVETKSKAFVGQIVLSCIVTWCCFIVFGFIAFILAIVANRKSANGHPREARRIGKASYCMSITGLILGFIFVSVLVGIYLGLLLANRGYFKFIGGTKH